jgi:pimeloyl-ACP methyl ester carboxylesterase
MLQRDTPPPESLQMQTLRQPRTGRRSSVQTARRSSARGAAVFGGLAIAAGAAAVANHLLAKRAEARNPPRGKFISVDGVRLHYLEQGSGPPLVLLHGNGVSSKDFEVSGLIDALAESHRVITFDRPGFGYSQRPRRRLWTAQAQARLLLSALAQLGVEQPVVIGHSWGSSVAVNLALEAPEALAGLVVLSGYYRFTVRPDVPLMAGPAIPVVGDVMRFTVSPLLARLITPLVLKQLFAPVPVTDRFKSGYPVSMSVRPSQLRASAEESMLMGWEAARLKSRLPQLSVPTLIIAGDGDKLISASHQSEWLAGQVAGSQFMSVEGSGHMLHHTAPREVASAIERFASRGPSPAGELGGSVRLAS